MPEPYDLAEATRLVCDVSALLAEAECGDSGGHETRRLMAEEELAGDAEAQALLGQAIDDKEVFYREVAALWGTMKAAFDERNMALVRGAHAGLRSLALRELEGGEADK